MKLIKATLSASIMALATSAHAVTLDFENIPGSVINSNGNMPTYQGFNFSSTLDWIDTNPDNGGGWSYGTHSGNFTLLNNNYGVGFITAADNSDFTFDGLWAKKWSTQPESGGADSLFGFIEGWKDNTLVWSVDTSLNGSFEYYAAQAGSIDQLVLGFGNSFLVDDLVLNAAAPVPEPSTYALMIGGLGLVGLMASRRKKA